MSEPRPSSQKPALLIRSESELETLVAAIDREMIADMVEIHLRPLEVARRITQRYDIELPMFSDEVIVPGSFTPSQISLRLHRWMTERYGDRLKVDWLLGRVVFPLRASLYSLRCPLVLGRVRFVCTPDKVGQPRSHTSTDGPVTCNVLDLVDGMTANLARSLTPVEVLQVFTVFVAGISTYTALRELRDVTFVREAEGDLAAAVRHLMEQRPQYGLSKWASLQASEKVLKAFIASAGDKVVPHHRLSDHAAQAAKLGLPPPPDAVLAMIQCGGGVRYGQPLVSEDEAVKAHLASLDVCEVIARHIGKVLGRAMSHRMDPLVNGEPLSRFLQRHVVVPPGHKGS